MSNDQLSEFGEHRRGRMFAVNNAFGDRRTRLAEHHTRSYETLPDFVTRLQGSELAKYSFLSGWDEALSEHESAEESMRLRGVLFDLMQLLEVKECSRCNGLKAEPTEDFPPCLECNGIGFVSRTGGEILVDDIVEKHCGRKPA